MIFTQVLVSALALVAAIDVRSEKMAFATAQVGEPHGDSFDDSGAIGSANGLHRRISTIAMGCAPAEHIYAFQIIYRYNMDARTPPHTVTHGPMPAPGTVDYHSLDLEKEDYVLGLWFTIWRAKVGFKRRRTRIGYLEARTHQGKSVACGVTGENEAKLQHTPNDAALLYFAGSAGSALDSLTPYWIPTRDF